MLIFWLFVVCIGVQCGYALYFFARILWMGRHVPGKSDGKGVSIIICAKNEAENLRKNLPLVLSQTYLTIDGKPNYEVIVVNDASTDDTAKVLQELEQRYDHLWDVPILPDAVRELKGKKSALSRGVAYATNDRLLLIDADCAPAGDKWLQQMAARLGGKTEIVAGYGGYGKAGGMLNAFIRWETLHTFLQYSTYALAGLPYMGVGRNMACTKEILEKAQQDPLWNVLPSGDDDLLVRIAGTGDNVGVVCDSAAFTYTTAKKNWREWVAQKQRHLSTGKYYKQPIKVLLGGYAVSHAAVWMLWAVLLCGPHQTVVMMIIGIRCLLYWTVWGVAAVRLREKSLILLFPIFDIAWLIYNFAFLPYITWKNKEQWT